LQHIQTPDQNIIAPQPKKNTKDKTLLPKKFVQYIKIKHSLWYKSARNFSQQSSRKLTADVGVVAMFLLSSFWKKKMQYENNEDSKQTFKRYGWILVHTSNCGTEYLPDSKPCANFVLNKIELINIFPF
jgi:hypothetical protein